jgi:hypothetical protein
MLSLLPIGLAIVLACAATSPPAIAAPPNDDFAAAEVVPTGMTPGSNVAATGETREPNHAGASAPLGSVWFEWPPARAGGPVAIDTCDASFDTTLAVYTGSSLGALREVASDDEGCGVGGSRVMFWALPGVKYRIAVDGWRDEAGTFTLDVFNGDFILPEQNDAFARAQVIPSQLGEARISSETTNTTGERGEPDHADSSFPLASVWFRWTAPEDAAVSIDTCAWADYDTTLAVYTGRSVNALTPVASDDDTCGSGSLIEGLARAGVTYWIAVDGFEEEEGQFVLTLVATSTAALPPPQPPPPPPPAPPLPPPTLDRTPPAVSLTVPRAPLRTAIASGVTLRVSMSEPGGACVRLGLRVATARRLGLRPTAAERRAGNVTVGTRCTTFTRAGNQAVRVRFSAKALRAFKRVARARGSVRLAATVEATDRAGNRRTVTRSVSLGR